MSEKDLDTQFAEIIAHWDEEAVRQPPVAQPGARTVEPDVDRGRPASQQHDGAGEPSALPRAGSNGAVEDVEDGGEGATTAQEGEPSAEEHFVPGPTAPLPPQEDLHFWAILTGLVGGPLLLLWLVLFRPGVSGWWSLLAVGLSVGGFVLLVLRQPHSREDDDPDDGARV